MAFDDDDNDEYEYDGDEYDEDDGFLNTASDLLDRLDDLPPKCDNFVVRFKDEVSGEWIQPEYWEIDEDGDVILGIYNDTCDYEEDRLSIGDLKKILSGDILDNNDSVVEDEMRVYIDIFWTDDDSDYCRPLDEFFPINWKKRFVVIPVRSSEDDD